MSEICLTMHSLACIVLNMSILNKLFIRNYLIIQRRDIIGMIIKVRLSVSIF